MKQILGRFPIADHPLRSGTHALLRIFIETFIEISERHQLPCAPVLVSSGADADRDPWVGLGIALKYGCLPSHPNAKTLQYNDLITHSHLNGTIVTNPEDDGQVQCLQG